MFSVLLIAGCGGGGGGDSSSPAAGLSAPTGVTATAGDNSASIAWSAVAGATSYNLYYSTTTGVPKATATKITGVTASPRVVTGLTNGTIYFFVVTAVDALGESADSSQVTATPALAPPPAPTGVTATAGHGEATIGWDNVAGATSYNVYYLTTSGVTKATGNKLANRTSPTIVTGLTNGTTYYFVVTAVNASGEGVDSSQVSAAPTVAPPPAAPTGVTAAAGVHEVTVSWPAVTGATSYNIYFDNTTPITKATINKVTGNTTSPKIVTGLINGTKYYFVVTAVDANGESMESSEVSATPTYIPLPAPPTGVTASAGPGEATISWSAVAGATSYNIYYSTTTGVTKATGIPVAGVASPKVVTGLIRGTPYYFVVTAVDDNGESVESSQVSATPFVEYVAFGDSITFGDSDDIPSDDTSLDGRNTGGGFEPVLNNLLTTAKGIPHSIVNEGYGGYKSSDGRGVLASVLANHPNAAYYLILFGTNDAANGIPTVDFKYNVQQIITMIKNAGKTPLLAKVPYTIDIVPSINSKIQEYNISINELVTENGITVVPPDFYFWFEQHPEQLANSLHPSGIGYQSMANLWLNALVP